MRTNIAAGTICCSVALLACGYPGKTRPALKPADAGPSNPDAGAPTGVSVVEYSFNPRFLYAKADNTIRLILRNEGAFQHSLVFEAAGIQGIPNGNLIDPGGAFTFSVHAPVTPGEYVFFCPVGDHRALGEQGTLIVANPPDAGIDAGMGVVDAGPSDAASPDGAAADASAADAGPDAAR